MSPQMSPSVRREQRNEQRAEMNARHVRPPRGDWQRRSGAEGARQLLSLQVLKSVLSSSLYVKGFVWVLPSENKPTEVD